MVRSTSASVTGVTGRFTATAESSPSEISGYTSKTAWYCTAVAPSPAATGSNRGVPATR